MRRILLYVGHTAVFLMLFSGAALAAPKSVWVQKPNGAKSCEAGSGTPLAEGAAELKKAGVKVLESRLEQDGKMHPQMCGAPTGGMNAYRISKAGLSKALEQGFRKK